MHLISYNHNFLVLEYSIVNRKCCPKKAYLNLVHIYIVNSNLDFNRHVQHYELSVSYIIITTLGFFYARLLSHKFMHTRVFKLHPGALQGALVTRNVSFYFRIQ